MKNNILFRGAVVGATVVAGVFGAQGLTIDFEGLEHGRIVNTQYAGTHGVTISVNNTGGGPDLGVAFNTNLTGTQDPDLESPWGVGNLPSSTDLGNILIIQENSNGIGDGIADDPDDEGSRPAGVITFDFDAEISSFGFDIVDVEGPTEYGQDSGYVAAFFNNGSEIGRVGFGDLIDSNSAYYDGTIAWGDNSINRVSPITSADFGLFDEVRISLGGSAGVDNVTFEHPPVPEPATMTLLGLGLAGLAVRSRKNRRP